MRDLTDGASEVEVAGGNVRRVVAQLEERFPGIAERVVFEGSIAPGLAVSIDHVVTSLGLLAAVNEDSVVHIVPAIAGG